VLPEVREYERAATTTADAYLSPPLARYLCSLADRARQAGLPEPLVMPLGLAMVDVHTVSAGGGSIAWADAGGALRVGPRSAGAQPGPAAYGAGGQEPT